MLSRVGSRRADFTTHIDSLVSKGGLGLAILATYTTLLVRRELQDLSRNNRHSCKSGQISCVWDLGLLSTIASRIRIGGPRLNNFPTQAF